MAQAIYQYQQAFQTQRVTEVDLYLLNKHWKDAVLKYFIRRAKHLFVDRNANVAVLFGLTLIPIAGAAASAVDYSRFYDTQSSTQEVLDATPFIMP